MIVVLVGTRPEIIKMAPVFKELRQKKVPFIFTHSNQHYTKAMDQQIINDLKLIQPDYHLLVGSGTHAVQTGEIMKGIEKICIKEKPKIVMVHGDTNTTLGGALAAKKLNIKVAHVEAGLRSFDYKMPEEVNRVITDRISDVLFAPTQIARENLLKEGIDNKMIVVTGNTIVDVLCKHLPLAKKSKVLNKLNLKNNNYILLTLHRAENVDDVKRFRKLLSLVSYISRKINKKVLWPIHPRSKKRIQEFNIKLIKKIKAIEPVGYIDMLALLSNTYMVLTDSGGIQEEAYILKRPLITFRDSTERPETLSANFIVNTSQDKVDRALKAYQQNKVSWGNELGGGKAGEKIVNTLIKYLKKI